MLAVLVSMAGVALEKQTLELRREVTRQYYRSDILLEQYARLRLKTQQLSAPHHVLDLLEDDAETALKSFQRPRQSIISRSEERPSPERDARRTTIRNKPTLLLWQRDVPSGVKPADRNRLR